MFNNWNGKSEYFKYLSLSLITLGIEFFIFSSILNFLSVPILISLTVSTISLALGSYSVSISIESDKKVIKANEKMEIVGKYNTLSALGKLEDVRFKLKNEYKKIKLGESSYVDISINIWKARVVFERIVTLEDITPKYKQKRKINYILFYFETLNEFIENIFIEINAPMSPYAKKENINHINYIYNNLNNIRGYKKEYPEKKKERLEDLKDKIIDDIDENIREVEEEKLDLI